MSSLSVTDDCRLRILSGTDGSLTVGVGSGPADVLCPAGKDAIFAGSAVARNKLNIDP